MVCAASTLIIPSIALARALPPLHVPPCNASGVPSAGTSNGSAEDDWRTKRKLLFQRKVRSIHANEARRLQLEEGYTLLDVRPKADFEQMHPNGAVNVELYRLIKAWTPWDIARRIGFAFFGILEGTEENPSFLSDVQSKCEKGSPIIATCSMGGTIKSSLSLPEGKESRSLIAAYLLVMDEYTNIFHLEGGVQAWANAGFPVESEINRELQ